MAIGEIGAPIEKNAEPGIPELVAIALEVIAAKLVDDDDHDELGMAVVSRGQTGCRGE